MENKNIELVKGLLDKFLAEMVKDILMDVIKIFMEKYLVD